MAKNIYKFKRNFDIGNLAAEDDEFLLKAFVEKSELELLLNISNTKTILLGRTGTGKSALIKYLENKEPDIVRIEPEALSLRHLSNSTIISYFKALDVKLDLFYKVLWKHVFIVELIKMRFRDDEKSNRILDWFKNKFKNDRRKAKAIGYLEKWEHHFWESTEYRVKEMESGLENRFSTEASSQFELFNHFKLSGNISHDLGYTEKIKTELLHKAQKVVNETQIEEIRDIMGILSSDLFINTQKRYFIVIDDLDKDWVDNAIVYDLIKGLIEAVNEFRKVEQVKIVIALRSNILEQIFHKNITRGIQREKYSHLYLDLIWSKDELKSLVNKRLSELMRGQYTKGSPLIEEIFPEARNNQLGGFDYILERTLMRPRDVIDFFNKCIKHADGKTKISKEIIRKAEEEYSLGRLQALNDEWHENYHNLFILYSFLKGSSKSFTISSIIEKAREVFFECVASGESLNLNTELRELYLKSAETLKTRPLLLKILIILYEVGLIGIKMTPENAIAYAGLSASKFTEDDLTEETKFYIHKMFHRALKVKEI